MAEDAIAPRELTSVAAPLEMDRVARHGVRALNPVYLVLIAIVLALPVAAAQFFPFGVSLATSILVFSIFTMSLDLLLGYAGLPSFGHAAFLGLGAYAAAILSAELGVSNLGVALIAAIALASAGSLVLGLLALRTSGVYFLMLTLAFAQMLSAVALKWGAVTGGTNGLPGVHSPELFVPGLTVGRGVPYYILTVVAAIVCFFLMYRLIHSPFGRTLIGIHQNEARMRAIGYNTRLYKLGAFWIAGVFASVAGVFYAFFNQFISPDDIGFTTSGTAVLMVLLGGEATLVGPILGTTAFLILQNVLSSIFTGRWQLILGALFVIFVLFVRGGIVGIWRRVRHGAA
ncbi:MAG: branched-chain amino acid ABC transporter permease [Chloroflexi bacterium]|nr:branched-chain amino acid ABC transporter permease [Chloroflexota bacterium]MBV9132883.1 branched-chain amino acid ABC transporter permease [Chloroflexota bacterium]MBV9899038.1 branched-chain amino acid ABC transporter permease [Chloroflexota bacterium]